MILPLSAELSEVRHSRDTRLDSRGLVCRWVLQGYSAGLSENAPGISVQVWARRDSLKAECGFG